MKSIYTYQTIMGDLTIVGNERAITNVFFGPNDYRINDAVVNETLVMQMAIKQINEYFAMDRKVFTVPVTYVETPFQEKVRVALEAIPYGKTRTYKKIASIVGRPKAYRAIGFACNSNRLCILVPCHRVISITGDLTGYSGGLEIKEKLLKLEETLLTLERQNKRRII